MVVEPSSAITLAFVRARAEQLEEPICVILTGENIAREDHRRLISEARRGVSVGAPGGKLVFHIFGALRSLSVT